MPKRRLLWSYQAWQRWNCGEERSARQAAVFPPCSDMMRVTLPLTKLMTAAQSAHWVPLQRNFLTATCHSHLRFAQSALGRFKKKKGKWVTILWVNQPTPPPSSSLPPSPLRWETCDTALLEERKKRVPRCWLLQCQSDHLNACFFWILWFLCFLCIPVVLEISVYSLSMILMRKTSREFFKKLFIVNQFCNAAYLDLLLCFNSALPDYYINASVC